MSQGENDYEKALQSLTSTIGNNISEGAKKADSFFSSACIYRVPEELRKLKKSAYTPRLIAIGPLHNKDKHLQTPMQQVKMSYTNFLLCRLTEGMDAALKETKKFTVLQECLVEMKTSLDNAVKCYAEEVALDEEMMLVDGCFILEVLYKFYEKNIPKEEGKKPFSTGGDNGNSKVRKLRASASALSSPL